MIATEIPADRLRAGIDGSGIGYAGIDGCWWLPACRPFGLPDAVRRELAAAGEAVFALFDTAADLLRGGCPQLEALLRHKLPDRLQRWDSLDPVLSLRPDFQLRPLADGSLQPVITELEICPSAHGYAHAMQAAYGLETDLARSFARFLKGRQLLFIGSAAWSEFLLEQLAFCRALEAVGARGRVLYDLPLAELAAQVAAEERWQPPIFGLDRKPAGWDPDLLGRIQRLGLTQYLLEGGGWPKGVGEAVIFRFGYLDGFSDHHLERMASWRRQGAVWLNPPHYMLDSKALMAALPLPPVRRRLAAMGDGILPRLDRIIPETLLLTAESAPGLSQDRRRWVLKYAGFDGGQLAWGGRSLVIGASLSQAAWAGALAEALALPWPVVAQQAVPTLITAVDYWDQSSRRRQMPAGHSRLRAFYLRESGRAALCGAHVTFSGQAGAVSEGSGAVQAPVYFV